MKDKSKSYKAPISKLISLSARGTILTGSPNNPGGTIDPFIFDEDE